eukprot:521904-Rhodomonas_salina.1
MAVALREWRWRGADEGCTLRRACVHTGGRGVVAGQHLPRRCSGPTLLLLLLFLPPNLVLPSRVISGRSCLLVVRLCSDRLRVGSMAYWWL